MIMVRKYTVKYRVHHVAPQGRMTSALIGDIEGQNKASIIRKARKRTGKKSVLMLTKLKRR